MIMLGDFLGGIELSGKYASPLPLLPLQRK